ncbi:site-specific integrase [Mycobacterium yunnanensis]|uniref:Site-specific integrase n=1 Tax=Mycobacterium yunnanensis TaxID=368477 RepID=A0A9X2Z8Z3_9MYCO|nr:site-specific integrase [Mycobacterium yunnanensis]MCV7424396.1 site-specific integrase [Mycobacterium yunnanensis]
MASFRVDSRKDGTTCTRVFFRQDGKQRCLTFDDHSVALRFKDLVEQVGATRAEEIARIERRPRQSLTVEQWLTHYVDHLSGVDKRTSDDYRGYIRTDFRDAFGTIPLAALAREDIAKWVQHTHTIKGAAAKTIANKHGFLSAALAAAVGKKHIESNPAANTGLPTDEPAEMVFLERDQYRALLAEIPEGWRPLVEFLVASGARWSEATALRPGDIDRTRNTVRITKAWKRGPYRIGPPKTKKSVRTINVSTGVLDKLDYTREWLFTNPGQGSGGPSENRRGAGRPVRAPNFRANVWNPAVARAWPAVDEHGDPIPDAPRPRIHDLRHTCASWLIQAGRPLPAVQAHLGHESILTTVGVYGHLDRSSGQGNADAIAAMLADDDD